MRKTRCIICGEEIMKSAPHDAFICRDCFHENGNMGVSRYWYLDKGMPGL